MTSLATRATVLADAFSLNERGISGDELLLGVTAAGIDELVETLMADGCLPFWH